MSPYRIAEIVTQAPPKKRSVRRDVSDQLLAVARVLAIPVLCVVFLPFIVVGAIIALVEASQERKLRRLAQSN